MAKSPCPPPQRFQDFLLGRVEVEQARQLEQHLRECSACACRVAAQRANLPRAEEVASTRYSEVAQEPLHDALEDTTIPPEVLNAQRAETHPSSSPATSSSVQDGNHEYDFLAPPLGPGEMGRLGPYRVLKVLGRGGMGVVFLGEDVRLGRSVALKVMLPEMAQKPEARERFLREAKAAATIEHDHIVAIYQVDEDHGVPYIAMPLLKGMSLEDWLRRKEQGRDHEPIRLGQILKLGREIARGLTAAHSHGLIHRDIKPANIWLDAGAGGRVKILDFGLARPTSGDQALTQSGMILGTPAYMAPEQAQSGKLDGRADLFSLGVILYRLCTGVQPFQTPDMMSTLMALATKHPDPPQVVNPELPPALSDLVMNLLEKDPARRMASAAEVAKGIHAIELSLAADRTEMTPAKAAPRKQTSRADSRRRPAAEPAGRGSLFAVIAIVAVVLLGGAVAGVIYFWPALMRTAATEAPTSAPPPTTRIPPAPTRSPPPTGPVYTSLFNGRNLDGWEIVGNGFWSAKDGVLKGDGGVGWLATKRDYSDFDLELEYRLPRHGNSGIFLRAFKSGALSGADFLEVQLLDDRNHVDLKPRHVTGALYNLVAPHPMLRPPIEEWHKVRVRARGEQITVWINGTEVVDAKVPRMEKSGRIGLQMSRPGVEFRNLRVRDLSGKPWF
jgi:serine/threonine protein kinase